VHYREPFEPLIPDVSFLPIGDVAALEASIAPWREESGLHWHQSSPSLEDVFIELMGRSKDNFQ